MKLIYVCDTFILWSYYEEDQTLMDHVNLIRPSIQFTLEKEEDYKLSFLDVLITRTEQSFRLSVYQTPTFIGQYFNFNS